MKEKPLIKLDDMYIPDGYFDLSEAEYNKICNGCGSSQAKFDFVPDSIWWLDISGACNIHDYMYHVAPPSLHEKEMADEAFLHNMLVLIERHTKNRFVRWLRRYSALKYYQAVDCFGGPAFWSGKA